LGKAGFCEPVKKALSFTQVSTRRNMMKKLLLFCLALALVATSLPAMAATNVNFSGYVKVFHQNLHNFNRARGSDAIAESFFANKVNLKLEFQPSEDVSIFWQLRSLNHVRWGFHRTGYGGGPADTSLYTTYVYAEIRQPWGTIQIGRVADGLGSNAGGLHSLGYDPTWGGGEFLFANPFDLNTPTDSVIYSYDFGNGFSIGVFYAKDDIMRLDDNDDDAYKIFMRVNGLVNGSPIVNARSALYGEDQDKDRFGIEAKYTWDTGGATFGVLYVRNMAKVWFPHNDFRDPDLLVDGYAIPYVPEESWEIHLNPSIFQSWGAFSIHFEGEIAFGRTKWRSICQQFVNFINDQDSDPGIGPCTPEQARDHGSTIELGLGLYFDASYNYGAGDITLMTWYAQGTSWEDRRRGKVSRNLVTMGDFAPFLVAFNGVTLGQGSTSDVLNGDAEDLDDPGNQFGIGLLGNHAINDDIKLNWGLGYFQLSEEWRRGDGRYLGFEVDVGATFQILENVSFETQFGYMWNGDVYRFRSADGRRWHRPDGTFAWANVLAVTF
jgi:hypothetical protein